MYHYLYKVQCLQYQWSNKRNFSSKVESKLDPYYVTGLCDAESSFTISIIKKNNKYYPKLIFKLNLHNRDKFLLEKLVKFFGVGKIYNNQSSSCQLAFQTITELGVIIDHFNNYPLVSKKLADFKFFAQAFVLFKAKKHLTEEGLQEIVNLRASMGIGLSEELITQFPNTKPVERPVVEIQEIPSPQWVAGFTEGDGSFTVRTRKSDSYKLGYSIFLGYIITQDIRDSALMGSLVNYFNCGGYSISTDKDSCEYHVYKTNDIIDIIIPFFKANSLHGTKALDFADFCEAAEIIKAKGHLTEEGLNQILDIKATMNKGR